MPDKQQLNFRFPSELLEKIKEDAQNQGISHTQWIINACRKQIGEDEESNIGSDSSSDIKNKIHSLEEQIRELRRNLDGLSCDLNYVQRNRLQKPKSRKDIAEDAYNQSTSGEDAVIWEIQQDKEQSSEKNLIEQWVESLTTSEIVKQHNVNPKSLNKYSQGKKIGDQWSYRGETYEVIHVNKKGEKKHKLVQKNDER